MFRTISNYLYGTPPTASIASAQSNEHPLIKLIRDKADIARAPVPLLVDLHRKLIQSGVNRDHPILKEISQRTDQVAIRAFGHEKIKFKHTSQVSTAEKKYVQPPTASIDDTLKALKSLEGNLDTIELCLVNDELMAYVVQRFPAMKSLQLLGNTIWDSFTNQGLLSIASLTALEELTIDVWDSLLDGITYDGFSSLFLKNNFASQLKHLKISTFWLVDDAFAKTGIATYPQLQTLYLQAAMVTEQGLSTLLSSSTLKKTVNSFTFFNSPGALTDNTIAKLNDFTALEHLRLCEGVLEHVWKISTPVFLAMLDTKKNLKTLDLRGPIIDGQIAEKLGLLNKLETLCLDNCSNIPRGNYWELFLKGKEHLKYLDLQNTPSLDEKNILFIANLSLNFLSLDLGEDWWANSVWMNILCTSSTLKSSLQTLHLTHLNNLRANAYAYLPILENLTSLRLDACPWFNKEALKFLSDSILAKKLNTLELIDAAIDDDAISMIKQFSQLKNLLVSDCHALTTKGCNQLLSDPFFQNQLVVFGANDFDWTTDDLQQLRNFNALKALILSNDSSTDGSEVMEIAKQKGFWASISWGITGYVRSFEDAIKDLAN